MGITRISREELLELAETQTDSVFRSLARRSWTFVALVVYTGIVYAAGVASVVGW